MKTKSLSFLIFFISPIIGIFIANVTQPQDGSGASWAPVGLMNGFIFWGLACICGTILGFISIKVKPSFSSYLATALNGIIAGLFIFMVLSMWNGNERNRSTTDISLFPANRDIQIKADPARQWDRSAYGSPHIKGFSFSIRFPEGPRHQFKNVSGIYSYQNGNRNSVNETPLEILKFGKAPGTHSINLYRIFVCPSMSLDPDKYNRPLAGKYTLKLQFEYDQPYTCTTDLALDYGHEFPF